MSSVFPFAALLADLCAPEGTSDLTLLADGRVGVRRNGRLAVKDIPGLHAAWESLLSELGFGREGQTLVYADQDARRYRVTLARSSTGQSVAVRPLPVAARSCDELLLPGAFLDYFVGLRSGLVLVAGPTGSGKSTTIASLLDLRGRREGGKYVTLEDPVECLHSGGPHALFEQRELGTCIASYAEGLKQALHMNPDVIAVQEIREQAAAETTLAAALSGHLVVASLHAFSGPTVPQRFLSILDPSMEDAGARDALASCLEAVLVQRLVPGFERMVPVFEIMLFRDGRERIRSMERLVRNGNWAGLRQEIEVGTRLGMTLWEDCLRRRVAEGLVPAN
jgi:twitching motility protein PilT